MALPYDDADVVYDDEEYLDVPEPDFDADSLTWQRTELYVNADGTISGRTATNDDCDRGYPTGYASWPESFRDFTELARRFPRKSPWRGILGMEVSVLVNGEHWDPEKFCQRSAA